MTEEERQQYTDLHHLMTTFFNNMLMVLKTITETTQMAQVQYQELMKLHGGSRDEIGQSDDGKTT